MTHSDLSDRNESARTSAFQPVSGLVWLTAEEAAQYLKVKSRTVLAWAREGKLKGYTLSGTERHVWRFLKSDLDDKLIASSVPCSERARVQ